MENEYIFFNMMSANFFSTLRTGNFIIDSILTLFIVSALPYVNVYVRFFYNFVKTYLYPDFSKNNSIVLEGSVCKNKYDEYHYNFTENSRAIFWYINKNIKSISGLTKLIELCVKKDRIYDESSDFWNAKISTNLIVNQTDELKLAKDIYVIIDIYDRVDDVSKGTSCGSQVVSKNVTITLFSKNGTVFTVNEFLQKCLEDYNNHLRDSMAKNQLYFIMNDDDNLSFTEYSFDSNTTFETIFFKDKKDIIKDIDFFENNRDFYKKKGLPRRYTLLLYGNHGSGKTSTIKCIANKTGRHIISINANLIKSKKMLEDIFYKDQIGKYTIPDDKKLYVIEEFDINNFSVVRDRNIDYSKNDKIEKSDISDDETIDNDSSSLKERKKMEKDDLLNKLLSNKFSDCSNKTNPEITLGDILQVLDGVKECEGRMLIITTNNIDKLDKALIRRGRINRQVKFGKPTKEDMIDIYKFYFGKKNLDLFKDIIDSIYNSDQVVTPADLVSFCKDNYDNSLKFLESLSNQFIEQN